MSTLDLFSLKGKKGFITGAAHEKQRKDAVKVVLIYNSLPN